MSKRRKTHTPRNQQSDPAVEGRSRVLKSSAGSGQPTARKTVSPTSEKIIKETSIKRRKAMQVLANR